MGFGFVEVGGVTPAPQPGNERPRVFRLKEDRAVVNFVGLPSEGAEVVATRLKNTEKTCVVGANVTKNAISKDAVADHARVVIEGGAVPIFCRLLSSPNKDVREQAVWALGNIAGDSPTCRDLVLREGAMQPLLQELRKGSKLSMLRNATWTLSNFCRGKPQPEFGTVRPALPTLAQLIYSPDEEVLKDA